MTCLRNASHHNVLVILFPVLLERSGRVVRRRRALCIHHNVFVFSHVGWKDVAEWRDGEALQGLHTSCESENKYFLTQDGKMWQTCETEKRSRGLHTYRMSKNK